MREEEGVGEENAHDYDDDRYGADLAASGDDEVYKAYAAMSKQRGSYQDSQRRLREVQKSRGFFKGELTFEGRKAAVAREQEIKSFLSLGRIGHWAGDPQCQKAQKGSPKKGGKGQKGGKVKVDETRGQRSTSSRNSPCSSLLVRATWKEQPIW